MVWSNFHLEMRESPWSSWGWQWLYPSKDNWRKMVKSMDWVGFKDVNCSLMKLWPLSLCSCVAAALPATFRCRKKQKLAQVGHSFTWEGKTEDSKTPYPCRRHLHPDLQTLAESLAPSLTGSRGGSSSLQEQTQAVIAEPPERLTYLPWAWKKIPGIFVIFPAVWDKKQCCKG